MPNLSIKDVPESWAEALRQRASRNHRSLQGELMSIIEAAAFAELEPSASLATPAATVSAGEASRPRVIGYDRHGWPVVRRGWLTSEQFFAELREHNVQPVAGQPLAVDIIRADRDAR